MPSGRANVIFRLRCCPLEFGFIWEEVSTASRAHPNDPILSDAWSRIKALDLGAELVISVFTDDEVAILVVEASGKVTWADHYAAVGTGSQIAVAFLHQRSYWDRMSLEECLYRVLEAKTAAERNPYVGKDTEVDFRQENVISFVNGNYVNAIQKIVRERTALVPNVPFEGNPFSHTTKVPLLSDVPSDIQPSSAHSRS
jgi:hypothetical protein